MNPVTTAQLQEALAWRYATKQFDASRPLSPEVWQSLLQALILTPSSYGLQPYRFLIIESKEKRTELLAHSWNQRQVVDASHYVVFASRTTLTRVDVDAMINRVSEVRGVPAETLKGYRDMMVRDLVEGPRSHSIQHWASKQAYIALGNLMTSAALIGVDTCPMEGLDPAEYDRILGLSGSGYTTTVACAVGYRASTDKYANIPKVRFTASTLVHTI